MKSLPTLDIEIANAVIQDRLDPRDFARLVAERYPDGFAMDTTPGLWTPAQLDKLSHMMRESTKYPVDRPATPASIAVASILEEVLAGRLTPEAAAEQLYQADASFSFGLGDVSRRKNRKIKRMMQHLAMLHVARGASPNESA